jgi:hypothetical protein
MILLGSRDQLDGPLPFQGDTVENRRALTATVRVPTAAPFPELDRSDKREFLLGLTAQAIYQNVERKGSPGVEVALLRVGCEVAHYRPLPLSQTHAFGVDDASLISLPFPVPSAGQFSRALMGHSCQAPKH